MALVRLATPAAAEAAPAWWEPLGLSGQTVESVAVLPGRALVVRAGGADYRSSDGGRTFQPAPGGAPPSGGQAPSGVVWVIRDGRVVTSLGGRGLAADRGAPFLGAGATLIAAPAALPGRVVAVGTDNHVWRREPSGAWATSFILLPAGGLSAAPRVTALAAFQRPLTVAVYMGTDGYGVLVSEDGGDDWIRAGPGLPDRVLGLATDPAAGAVYAATDQGLYVHHLQQLPAPPAYRDASLLLRWLGMALVALLASLAGVVGLRRALGRP